MKNIVFILIAILFISCTMEPEVVEDLNNTVIIENDYTEIDLSYVNNPYATSIIFENISDKLIIELNYSIDDYEYSRIELFLPKERLVLYTTSKDNLTITCKIKLVVFY